MQHNQPREGVHVDFDALSDLTEEFGRLASWKVKKDNDGTWSRGKWEDLIARLYENRDMLEGITDVRERGKAALDAMSDAPDESMQRIAGKIAERARQRGAT